MENMDKIKDQGLSNSLDLSLPPATVSKAIHVFFRFYKSSAVIPSIISSCLYHFHINQYCFEPYFHIWTTVPFLQ